MRFLSLFTGIGGFDLDLERAGMKCVGQVEIDPFCNRVLEKHWPHVKRIRDIHDVTGNEFGAVELICGGFPCQPFSVAGKRKGKGDDRYLWPEMLRVIEVYRPSWIIGENVAGIIGVELNKVLSDLEGIGYQVQCFIIPACAVDAPHRRDRVWIVAHSIEQQWDRRVCGACRWEREPLETVQDAGKRGWEEDGLSIPESLLGRVANGVPGRVDRLRSLGNAVVPQIVEIIGKVIMEIENNL